MSKAKRRRVDDPQVQTGPNFMQFVSILGRFGRSQIHQNDHRFIQHSANFYAQHAYSSLLEIFPEILTPDFLCYNYINKHNFDNILFVVWQHCLLTIKMSATNHRELNIRTQECNKIFEECLKSKRAYHTLSVINQSLQRGQFSKARSMLPFKSNIKDQSPDELFHFGVVRNIVELVDDWSKGTEFNKLPKGETFFPLIKESRFFDWTLTTLSLVCEGNDATSKILIDILAERLPRNYSYAGHSALSNLSLRLNKYPLKMKALHPLSSQVQELSKLLEEKLSEEEEDIESETGVPGLTTDHGGRIREFIRVLIQLIESPGVTAQERQMLFFQLRVSLKRLSTIKSEKKVKKFLLKIFDWMRIRVWFSLFGGKESDSKFGDLLWNLLYPGFVISGNPIAMKERETLLFLTDHLDFQEIPDIYDTSLNQSSAYSWVKSRNYCKYTPGLSICIYRNIETCRDLGYLGDFETFREVAILLKFSDENRLYEGDDPSSEPSLMPFKFSRGHLKFVRKVHKCLWKSEDSIRSSSILRAKRMVEEAFYNSFSRLIYTIDPDKIRMRISQTPWWRTTKADLKYENEITNAFITGTCCSSETKDRRLFRRIKAISVFMNYYPFFNKLDELKSLTEDLSRRYRVKKEGLDKLVEELEKNFTLGILDQIILRSIDKIMPLSRTQEEAIIKILHNHFQPIMNE